MTARRDASAGPREHWILTYPGSTGQTDLNTEFVHPADAPAPVQFVLRANRSQPFAPFLQALSQAANLGPVGAEARGVDSLPVPADFLGDSMSWNSSGPPGEATFHAVPAGPWEVYDLRFRAGGGGRLLLGLDRSSGQAMLVPPYVASEEEEIGAVVVKFALLGLWLPKR